MAEYPVERFGFAFGFQRLFHEIEVSVGGLVACFFQPRRPGQHHVGGLTRGIAHKEIEAYYQFGFRETRRHGIRVGKRRQHVGAHQQHDIEIAVSKGRRYLVHLLGNLPSRLLRVIHRGYVTRRRSIGTVARPHSAAGNAEIAGKARQARNSAGRRPGIVALVHGTAAQQDHRRFDGGASARQGRNTACG